MLQVLDRSKRPIHAIICRPWAHLNYVMHHPLASQKHSQNFIFQGCKASARPSLMNVFMWFGYRLDIISSLSTLYPSPSQMIQEFNKSHKEGNRDLKDRVENLNAIFLQ